MKPTVPEVLPLVRELYARHAAGCCLHCVLDDGNVEDYFVESAITFASKEGCQDCLDLAMLLFRMSKTQRWKLYRGPK